MQRFRSALGMLARGAGPHGQIALNLGYFMRHRGEDDESLIDG